MGSNYRNTEKEGKEQPVFCPYCGGEVHVGDKICTHCGKSLPEKLIVGKASRNTKTSSVNENKENVENPEVIEKTEVFEKTEDTVKRSGRASGKKSLLVVLAVVLLGGIGVAVFVLFAGKNANGSEEKAKQELQTASSSSSSVESLVESDDSSIEESAVSPTPTPLPKVKVPSLVGKTVAKAKEAAQKKKLALQKDGERPDSTHPNGTIIEQNPKADKKVEEGTTIHYIVSSGPEKKKVPDVINLKREEAKKKLSKAGFENFKILYQSDSKIASGRVFQVKPNVGKKTPVTDIIKIYISTGSTQSSTSTQESASTSTPSSGETATTPSRSATVSVREYRNLLINEARNRCAQDSLVVGTQQTYKNGVGDGVVVAQSISPGTAVGRGTKIILTVNKVALKPTQSDEEDVDDSINDSLDESSIQEEFEPDTPANSDEPDTPANSEEVTTEEEWQPEINPQPETNPQPIIDNVEENVVDEETPVGEGEENMVAGNEFIEEDLL